ncbi:MAG: tetratricopeptide repeat protein [Vampirovibrionales bacterium]|nr:tetratricopeptide repeat protein [Vampirovibrionales bacterium]
MLPKKSKKPKSLFKPEAVLPWLALEDTQDMPSEALREAANEMPIALKKLIGNDFDGLESLDHYGTALSKDFIAKTNAVPKKPKYTWLVDALYFVYSLMRRCKMNAVANDLCSVMLRVDLDSITIERHIGLCLNSANYYLGEASPASALKRLKAGFSRLKAYRCSLKVQTHLAEALTLAYLKAIGEAYYQLNQHRLAQICYEQFLKLDAALEQPAKTTSSLEYIKDKANLLTTLGQLYVDAQQPMRALYYYRQALSLMPEKPYLHSRVGYVLVLLRDFEAAIQSYQKAVSCSVAQSVDKTWLATVCLTLAQLNFRVYQQPETSVAWAHMAMNTQPGDAYILSQVVDLLNELGDLQGALAAYKPLTAQQPQSADHMNYMGYLLWQMDRNQDACDAYQKAIEANAENYVAYNNLGVIYLDDLNDSQKAKACFEQALKLKPDYTMACFNLGRSYEQLGRTEQAAAFYSDALSLNLENPELDTLEIQERLSELFKSN